VSDGTSPPRWLAPCGLGVALTAVALWLRVPPLDPPSLWLDDLWVVAPSRATSVGDALEMMVTAPGFSALANLLPWLVGPASWAAQLLPFLAGVAAPAVALAVGRWMGWGWPASAATATVMAVAPEHLLYSTRVKQYTLEALVGLALLGLAWAVVERRSSAWWLAAAAVGATVLSGSAGTFAGAVLGAACVVAVVSHGGRLRELAAPAGAFGAFAVLWWVVYLRTHVPEGLRDFWRDEFLRVDEGPRVLLLDVRDSLSRTAEGFVPVDPAWFWLLLALVALVVWIPRLAVLVLAPVGVAVLLAALHQAPLGVGRTEVYLLPAAAVAVGGSVHGLTLRRALWARGASAAVAVGLCAALLVGALEQGRRDQAYPHEDVRGFIEEAQAGLGASGQLVLVYPATRWAWAIYSGRPFEPVRSSSSPTGFDLEMPAAGLHVLRPHRDDPEAYGAELEAAVEGQERVVFIASHWQADITAIEAWFPAHGWAEVTREATEGGRRVEYRRTA
jgi:hypothetical protein